MRLPFAPHATRHATIRRLAAPLIGGALLVGSFIAPAVAAPSSSHTKWTAPERRHEVTRGHVASVGKAAKVAHRAAVATPSRPLLSVKIAHPPTTAEPQSSQRAVSTTPRIVSPDLTNTLQFDGLAQADSGDVLPPDPWVAVNSTSVVQIVNQMVRVSNRSGAELQMIPTWLLFGLTADQIPSDGRIIWDAVHGRWVGVALSFNGSFTSNFLRLAVSDGADPTAGWSTYAFDYGSFLPDYPSVASSGDKIVLTDNLFDPSPSLLGADLLTITWSSILGGATPVANECANSDFANPRAAQALSPGNDVHLIMEATFDRAQWYWRLNGAGTCFNIVDGTNFTGLGPFKLPPDPRQTPLDTIGTGNSAVDERPTDAIWQNNHLWWVSTYPVSYDGGVTKNDAVYLWNATTATSGSPTNGTPVAISAGNGTDDFMGGIGMTRGGALVVVYSHGYEPIPAAAKAVCYR